MCIRDRNGIEHETCYTAYVPVRNIILNGACNECYQQEIDHNLFRKRSSIISLRESLKVVSVQDTNISFHRRCQLEEIITK